MVQEDIGRLEIAMEQANAVSLLQGGAHRLDDIHAPMRRQLAGLLDLIGERTPLEQLHHEIGNPRRRNTEIKNRYGIGMLDPAGRHSLALETREILHRCPETCLQDLDGYMQIQPKVGRLVDCPEISGTDFSLEAIFLGKNRTRHRTSRLVGGACLVQDQLGFLRIILIGFLRPRLE